MDDGVMSWVMVQSVLNIQETYSNMSTYSLQNLLDYTEITATVHVRMCYI